ncbi:MAG TPA: class F sortase [Candidatus Paceibacterota bacterium]
MEHTQFNGDSDRPVLALPSPKTRDVVIRRIQHAAVPITLVGLGLSLALVSYVSLQDSTENGLVPAQEKEDSGLPVRLIIPAITVDAPLEYVGLAPDGVMGVPESPDNGAWFEQGPRPGEAGSAVIAGHYGWKDGKTAVFDNLHTLQKGDKLHVVNDRGEIVTFVVREIRSYDPQADAGEVFGSSDGRAHLNLITCEGTWNKTQNSYSKRLVIFTDKE